MNAPASAAVSLVVGTVGRPNLLARLLSSLAEQGANPMQVIVVDQGGPEQFAENAAAITRHAGAVDVLHLRQAGRGLSRARNLGLGHVRGDIVGFPDDDCWYPAGLVARVCTWFQENPAYDFLSGRYADPASPVPTRFDPRATDLTTWNAFLRVPSVTLFFRRSALAGERFDERLGAGCAMPAGEETDFVLRLLRRGRRGRYVPDLVVHHPVERPNRADIAVFRRLEAAYGFVLAKHALAGSGATAARLALGLSRAAACAAWSPKARASLVGRWHGVAAYLAARGGQP